MHQKEERAGLCESHDALEIRLVNIRKRRLHYNRKPTKQQHLFVRYSASAARKILKISPNIQNVFLVEGSFHQRRINQSAGLLTPAA